MTSYINLTNRLLRRINEVEIPEEQFTSVRGLQAAAKDAILDTIRQINNKKNNWIFNAVEHTQVLTQGQEEYPWPLRFTNVDWTSYQIQKNNTLGILDKHLIPITREEWYRRYRDYDYDVGVEGRSIPVNVFPTHGQGWGLTPSPDKAYTVKYRYFKSPEDVVEATDLVTIPDRFDYVIIAGGLYHLNLFKDNAESTQISKQHFNEGLTDMVRKAVSWPVEAIDTRFRSTWSYDG